jgi:hypothetical protein
MRGKSTTLDFSKSVYSIVQPELAALGYEQVTVTDIEAIGFQKNRDGWLYRVEFQQLAENRETPQSFQVTLIRLPMPFDFAVEYTIDFLMETLGPVGHPDWVFVDEDSLRKQLARAADLLKTYGIPWLEDPKSVMSTAE